MDEVMDMVSYTKVTVKDGKLQIREQRYGGIIAQFDIDEIRGMISK